MSILLRSWPIFFALGFFSLLAQAVLFRHFLACIAMSELAIGLFFASWLAWIGIGALAGRASRQLAERLAARLPWAALFYAPAAVAQFAIISQMRLWLGVPAGTALSLPEMVIAAFGGNALVSLGTGFLFAVSCHYLGAVAMTRTAVNAIYACEAAGGFAGGVVATLLPALGAADEVALFSGVALLMVIAAADAHATVRQRFVARALAVGALVLLALFCQRWREANDNALWTRALPASQLRGCFRTPYGRYAWGVREGQHIVLGGGSEVEALPDRENAARTVALHLAQKPDSRRILLIGPGALALAGQWLKFRPVEITWLHPDPYYPPALSRAVPAAAEVLARVSCPAVEPRKFLAATAERFDLVILALGEVNTISASRFATADFLRLARGVLKPDGILSWRIPGGENYLGPELAWLGASAVATLQTIFAHLAIKAGAETWLFASGQPVVSEDPATLVARYAAIPDAESLYSAAALAALYSADRSRFQRQRYEEAGSSLPTSLLVSDDLRPASLLYGLSLAWRRYDLLASKFLLTLWEKRWWVAIGLLICYALCRRLALTGATANRLAWGKADSCLLVFFGGLASMASAILLMFRLQIQCGSLFLVVGLVSSLFLLGAAVAAFFVEAHLQKGGDARRLLLIFAICQVAFCLSLGHLPPGGEEIWHALLFLFGGFLASAYFPLASHWLSQRGESAHSAGGWLEACDHIGAALGALASANLLLPLFGMMGCAAGIALAVAAGLAPYAVPAMLPEGCLARLSRAAAAALVASLGIALLAAPFAAPAPLPSPAETAEAKLFAAKARQLCGNRELRAAAAVLPDGRRFVYWRTVEDPPRYVFSTETLAPEAIGFGGPLHLLVCADSEGKLIAFSLLAHRESAAYLERTLAWQRTIIGHNIFTDEDLAGAAAVTGATRTSAAILTALRLAGKRFAASALGRSERAEQPARAAAPSMTALIFLLAAFVAAAVLRFSASRLARWLFSAAVVFGLGWWANWQFASGHAALLLRGDISVSSLAGLFAIAVAAVVILCGNLYCGYVCPFGALQDIVAAISPAPWRAEPGKNIYGWARLVKYGFLLLLALSVLGWWEARMDADPLSAFFSGGFPGSLALAALALSLFYRRFWCRLLCPAGALLSLLASVGLARRFFPPPAPERCDLGVGHANELDCILCDRCRLAPPAASRTPSLARAISFLVSLAVVGVFFGRAMFAMPAVKPPAPKVAKETAQVNPIAGQSRRIDVATFRRLLKEKRLADHTAEYQRPAPDSGEEQTTDR